KYLFLEIVSKDFGILNINRYSRGKAKVWERGNESWAEKSGNRCQATHVHSRHCFITVLTRRYNSKTFPTATC
ncbi:hypothetical protein STEG23_034732, partial [Scotinomys teguina]